MSCDCFVDTREVWATSLADALKWYCLEVSDLKKCAKPEGVRSGAPLASTPLGKVTSSGLAEYRDTLLAEGKSAATERLNLAIISHLFTVAAKQWNM